MSNTFSNSRCFLNTCRRVGHILPYPNRGGGGGDGGRIVAHHKVGSLIVETKGDLTCFLWSLSCGP